MLRQLAALAEEQETCLHATRVWEGGLRSHAWTDRGKIVMHGTHAQACMSRQSCPGMHEQAFMCRHSCPGMHEQAFMCRHSCPGMHVQAFMSRHACAGIRVIHMDACMCGHA